MTAIAYKTPPKCCGVVDRFTVRVTELLQVLDDLNRGKYKRTMVNTSHDKQKGTLILYGQVVRLTGRNGRVR